MAMSGDEEDKRTHIVLVNHEEQYSLWVEGREIPKGWRQVGPTGPKEECLKYVGEVWTDMRPLSLRKQMEADAKKRAAEEKEQGPKPKRERKARAEKTPGKKELNELVVRLTKEQPVETARPEKTAQGLKERIDRDYVHVMFTNTGTEIGIQLDRRDCRFDDGNFEEGTGKVRLVGGVTLNYDKVRCVAEVDLATCEGTGHLEPVDDEEYERIMGRAKE